MREIAAVTLAGVSVLLIWRKCSVALESLLALSENLNPVPVGSPEAFREPAGPMSDAAMTGAIVRLSNAVKSTAVGQSVAPRELGLAK